MSTEPTREGDAASDREVGALRRLEALVRAKCVLCGKGAPRVPGSGSGYNIPFHSVRSDSMPAEQWAQLSCGLSDAEVTALKVIDEARNG